MKKKLSIILRMLLIVGLCVFLLYIWQMIGTQQISGEARFIFAGTKNEADCTILLSGGYCVMIDSGEAVDAEHILELLKSNGVEKIDCLILSHPDNDHIGSASALLDSLPVKQVLVPYFSGEKQLYSELRNKLASMNIPCSELPRDRQFAYGELDVQVFPPHEFNYDKSNNYSLAVLVRHGDVSAFFPGDAEKKRLNEIDSLQLPSHISLYKCVEHGRASEESVKLIEKLTPQYTVITSAAPEETTAKALESVGSISCCTVGKDVSFVSNGKQLRVLE